MDHCSLPLGDTVPVSACPYLKWILFGFNFFKTPYILLVPIVHIVYLYSFHIVYPRYISWVLWTLGIPSYFYVLTFSNIPVVFLFLLLFVPQEYHPVYGIYKRFTYVYLHSQGDENTFICLRFSSLLNSAIKFYSTDKMGVMFFVHIYLCMYVGM